MGVLEVNSSQAFQAESAQRGADSYDLNTPLTRLLEDAVAAEVCLFMPGRVQLGASCRACTAGPDGQQDMERACPVVQALASGQTLSADECPAICLAGRPVQLHTLENATGSVLVVDSAADEAKQPVEQRLPAVAALWERCERLAGETEGLAQEVIRSYEQLNVIFDITQQITKPRDAAQVKHFLIRRLAQTLNCDWSCCLSTVEGVLWWCANGDIDRDEMVAHVRARHGGLLYRVLESRTPLVFNRNQDPDHKARYSLLFSSLGDASASPDVLIFARSEDQQQFLSGDLMMIDSMLSHAQHVLSNLKLVERLRTMSLGAVRALVSAIDKKDHYTSGHSERVGFLSQLIGERLGLSPEQLQDLQWGGLLHDVGKIGIQDGILTKPGSLTPEEFDQIKQHAIMSHEIVAPIDCMASVREVVLYHHEVPDGSGYPKGLKGDEVPLLARIVHVADTFDALTTSRSYRSAFPISKALAIMNKEKGTKLDSAIVDSFVEAFATFRAEQPDQYQRLFSHLLDAEAQASEDGSQPGGAAPQPVASRNTAGEGEPS